MQENASTFGARLGRVLYDLDRLGNRSEGIHALDACLDRMLGKAASRAAPFASVARGEVPFWAAGFAATVAITLGRTAENPAIAARFWNHTANYLSLLGRREEAMAAVQEAAGLYRELARVQPEAFRPGLATSVNNLANRLSELGRREEAMAAAQEAAGLYRELARVRPEVFDRNFAIASDTLARITAAARSEDAGSSA